MAISIEKILLLIPFNTIRFYEALLIEIMVRVQKMCLSDFKTFVDKCLLISFLKVHIRLKQALIFVQEQYSLKKCLITYTKHSKITIYFPLFVQQCLQWLIMIL